MHDMVDGRAGPLAEQIRQLDWRADAMGTHLEAWLSDRASAWVVDLAVVADQTQFLRALSSLPTVAPLLLVTEPSNLSSETRHLNSLFQWWPARVDVLIRPYTEEELEIRLRQLARQARRRGRPPSFGNIRFDSSQRTVQIKRQVKLTETQARTLRALMEAGGEVLPRAELAALLHARSGAAIETQISRLRKKMVAAGGSASMIVAARGAGYRLVPDQLMHDGEAG